MDTGKASRTEAAWIVRPRSAHDQWHQVALDCSAILPFCHILQLFLKEVVGQQEPCSPVASRSWLPGTVIRGDDFSW